MDAGAFLLYWAFVRSFSNRQLSILHYLCYNGIAINQPLSTDNCSDALLSDCLQNLIRNKMGNQSSKGNSATKGEVYHMLLVVKHRLREDLLSQSRIQRAAGSQTWLRDECKQFRKYNNIKFENPSKRPMESATIGSELYEVRFEDMTIGIIDTPGFGDTRGFEIDKQNVKNIVDKVNGVEYINCICFVINDARRGSRRSSSTSFQRYRQYFRRCP